MASEIRSATRDVRREWDEWKLARRSRGSRSTRRSRQDGDDRRWLLQSRARCVRGRMFHNSQAAKTHPTAQSAKPTALDVIQDLLSDSDSTAETPNTLSLFITASFLDDSMHDESVYPTAILVGIKPPYTDAGQRFAASAWLWHIDVQHDFSKSDDYFEATLPLVSDILKDPRVSETDEFSVCVLIGSPESARPTIFPPDILSVPVDFLNSFEDLLDAKTGDVRFICLEHELVEPTTSSENISSLELRPAGARSGMHTRSRKRVIHAHSQILRGRSEYFKSLLTGGFAETETARKTESGMTSVVVDDANFITIYWLLRWVVRLAWTDLQILVHEFPTFRSGRRTANFDGPDAAGPQPYQQAAIRVADLFGSRRVGLAFITSGRRSRQCD